MKSSRPAKCPCGTPRCGVFIYLSGSHRTPPQTPPAKLSWSVLKAPALTRLQDGTCTAPTLGAGWCRVTPTSRRSTVSSIARLLRVFDSFPTGSFQQQQIRPFLTRRSPERIRFGTKTVGPSITPQAAQIIFFMPPSGGFFRRALSVFLPVANVWCVSHNTSFYKVDHVFRNVGCVVCDALKVP